MEVKGMAQHISARCSTAITNEGADGEQQTEPPSAPTREQARRAASGIIIRHTASTTPPALARSPKEQAASAGEGAAAPVKRRIVEVRDLQAEREGRVFPCLDERHGYTGCIGYEQCAVLCWASRPQERQAVVRVEQASSAPCRTCLYAREVYGDVAILNGRQVRLIECRLGFWHGRAPVGDFLQGKIPVNVDLPCPGYVETDAVQPALARARGAARLRKQERE
jgi:hypothetical protein